MNFWERFKYLCELKGSKPNPVGKEIGFSSGSITYWKNGTIPSGEALSKIAVYFGVTIDYLLGNTDEKNPLPKRRGFRIPVLGKIAAGIPIEAIEDILDYEEIDEAMAACGTYFGLQIQGESMLPRFVDGDVVIVRQQSYAETGDIVAVLINNEGATVKKIVRRMDGITLVPTNTAFSTIEFTNKDILEIPVKILGKVVELRAKFV